MVTPLAIPITAVGVVAFPFVSMFTPTARFIATRGIEVHTLNGTVSGVRAVAVHQPWRWLDINGRLHIDGWPYIDRRLGVDHRTHGRRIGAVLAVDGHADTCHTTNGGANHGSIAPTDGLADQGTCHGTQTSAQNRIQVVCMGKWPGQTCQGKQQACTGAQSIAFVSMDEHGVVKGREPRYRQTWRLMGVQRALDPRR